MAPTRRAALLLLTTTLPGYLTAQDHPPCSQPILSEIRFLEGAWRIQFRSRLSANPTDWESGVATATIESLLRGCAFLERYAATRDGRRVEAVRLFAATPGGSGLRVVLADSEHGPLFAFDGGPEGDGVAFYTQVMTPAGQVRLRLRFQVIGADYFVTESSRSVDEGKTWDTTGLAEYRRSSR